MEEMLYHQAIIAKGLTKNQQMYVILYKNRLELYTSAKYPKQELKEIRNDMYYVQKEVAVYSQLSGSKYFSGSTFGIKLYGTIERITEQGREEVHTLELPEKLDSITIYNIIALYFPINPAYIRLTEALRNPDVPKGELEIHSKGSRLLLPDKFIDVFVNGELLHIIRDRVEVYKIALPYGDYVIHFEHDRDGNSEYYRCTNKVQIKVRPERPVVKLKFYSGVLNSIKLKEIE
ncbi:MAG: hypothetical protein NC089_09670 [Bacteroides sp.]|nr:hypothetical protein [Bacteroides sp.]MCM1549101.1 hypothetical protein [Clostridium sp.]